MSDEQKDYCTCEQGSFCMVTNCSSCGKPPAGRIILPNSQTNREAELIKTLRAIVDCDYHDEKHDPETLYQLITACENGELLINDIDASR